VTIGFRHTTRWNAQLLPTRGRLSGADGFLDITGSSSPVVEEIARHLLDGKRPVTQRRLRTAAVAASA